MKTIRTVFLKEIVDNLRDRRTLLSALLMGPLFGPVLFAFVINLSVKQSLENAEEPLDLPVIGREHAPNLISYLESRNIVIKDGPETRQAAIEAVTGLIENDVLRPVNERPGKRNLGALSLGEALCPAIGKIVDLELVDNSLHLAWNRVLRHAIEFRVVGDVCSCRQVWIQPGAVRQGADSCSRGNAVFNDIDAIDGRASGVRS